MTRWTMMLGAAAVLGMAGVASPVAAQVARDTAQPAVLADSAPTDAEIATTEPPAPMQERMGRAPSRSHIWVGGYWHWRTRRWAWIRGRWAIPPRGFHAWVPGHWMRFRRGWYWRPGHWR
jgi:hypothetical protein